MNKLFKKYLAKLNDFAHITPTHDKFIEIQRLQADMINGCNSGKITFLEKQALMPVLNVIMDDMRNELKIQPISIQKQEPDDWAKKEIDLAISTEKEAANGTDDWKYGAACYESAYQAYQTLMQDNHSGFSIQLTKSVLNRLIDGKPLTPVDDTDNSWNEITWNDKGDREYQHKRMSSLFKKVNPEGTATYSDINRITCVDIQSPNTQFHNGLATRLIDKLFPVSMPYMPSAKQYKVFVEEFLTEGGRGDYDTIAYLYILTPEGLKIDLNRYFKEDENDKMVPIEKEEYEERKTTRKDEKKFQS